MLLLAPVTCICLLRMRSRCRPKIILMWNTRGYLRFSRNRTFYGPAPAESPEVFLRTSGRSHRLGSSGTSISGTTGLQGQPDTGGSSATGTIMPAAVTASGPGVPNHVHHRNERHHLQFGSRRSSSAKGLPPGRRFRRNGCHAVAHEQRRLGRQSGDQRRVGG